MNHFQKDFPIFFMFICLKITSHFIIDQNSPAMAIVRPQPTSLKNNFQLALLTIILSMIHMANNALDENDLWDTLKILGIDK